MKKLNLVSGLVIVLLIVVSSCTSGNTNEIKISLGTSFDLPVGKTALFKSGNISMKFDSVITDSRCPTGVTRIWAGEAKCKLIVTKNGIASETILTQPGSSESLASGIGGDYQVSFKLNPYPASGHQIAPEDYVLSLKLFK